LDLSTALDVPTEFGQVKILGDELFSVANDNEVAIGLSTAGGFNASVSGG
jgi:hypothetical protein